MDIRTLTIVLGAALTVAAGGVSATACSSSSGGGSPVTTKDSGGGTDGTASSSGGSSSSGSSSGSTSSSGGSSDGGTGVDCGSIPGLHVDEAGTIYCGFADAGDLSCPVGQQCCLGGEQGKGNYFPQICATWGNAAACTNGSTPEAGADNFPAIPIECNQVSDCTINGATSATACCLQGGIGPTAVAGCSYSKVSEGTAIVCEGADGGAADAATACQAGEVQNLLVEPRLPRGPDLHARQVEDLPGRVLHPVDRPRPHTEHHEPVRAPRRARARAIWLEGATRPRAQGPMSYAPRTPKVNHS